MEYGNAGATGENSVEDMIARFKEPLKMLIPYLGWLEENMDKEVAQSYSGSELKNSIPFPVYDSTLLSFVKTAQATGMMDRNWPYVFTRNKIRTLKDEREFIDNAQVQDMEDLFGIIAKYVLSGMTRGGAWGEGVRCGSMYYAIVKMRELMHYWGERDV